MDYQSALKSLKLSVTPVRLAILESLDCAPHSEAADIFELVQKKIQTTSIQAVYKNLNTFVENGLVREIKPKGMSSIYEICKGDNHYHLVCRTCGLIKDKSCADSMPWLETTDTEDLEIDHVEIIFWGQCNKDPCPHYQNKQNQGEN